VFSCLMACYGGDDSNELYSGVLSLVAQTLPADEVVLVEDGPLSKELVSVIAEFEERLPLRRLKLDDRGGLGRALQMGLTACQYDMVARMDADDVADPQRFATQIAILEKMPTMAVLGTWAKEIDDNGVVVGERRMPVTNEAITASIWANPIIHSSVVLRKADVLGIGGYDKNLARRQDYDLWFRCVANGLQLRNVPEFLIYYRLPPVKKGWRALRQAWQHTFIGWKWAHHLGLSAKIRIYIMWPLVRLMLPTVIVNRVKTKDPRTHSVGYTNQMEKKASDSWDF